MNDEASKGGVPSGPQPAPDADEAAVRDLQAAAASARAELDPRLFVERLAALVQVQRMLATTESTLDELIDRIPDLALQVVPAYGAVFELLDGDAVIFRAGSAATVAVGALGQRLALEGSLTGEAIRLGGTVRCDDTELDDRVALDACRRFGLRAVLVTVVRDQHGPIGALKLFDHRPRQFGLPEADSIELLAEALGAIIQRKRAEEEGRRTVRIQSDIARIQHEVARCAGGLTDMMTLMARRAQLLLGADGAAVLVVDGAEMVVRAGWGGAAERVGRRQRLAGSLAALAIAQGQALHCEDTEQDPRVDRAMCRELGARSLIAAPLIADDVVVGAMRVFSSRVRAFGPAEVAAVQILAEFMGVVMLRDAALIDLRLLNETLESKVAGRTADLELMNAALAAKEEEMRSVVEHMADGVLTFSDDGVIRAANPRVESIFGHVPKALVGRRIGLLIPALGDLGGGSAGGVASAIGRISRETAGRRRDGEPIILDVAISGYSVRDEKLWTAVVRDIGERVRIMADLEQARQDAEQASRAKSTFVATMSHEIRTPMNGVIGMIDVLRQTLLDAEQAKMLDLARESAYALLEIIEDILDFSKIESGRMELDRQRIAVATVIEKTCALARSMADGKGVELRVRIDPALHATVWGDAGRLRQVLVNLVVNAVKFSGGRGTPARVRVVARVVAQDTRQMRVEIAVEDNGIGMDAATVARLFTPFAQADASMTRRFGGTGLGLAISKNLVGLMGGDIRVASRLGTGSRFTVRLPFEPAPGAAPAEPDAVAVRPLPALPSARRPDGIRPVGRVLVAEDNEINQEVIRRQLKLIGFEAEIVANGVEALVGWRTGRFALLLTDLQMPEMDGYELTARIRAAERGQARIPIVALTANALKEESDRCKAVGMDDYLTKPVQVSKLDAVLTRWMQPKAPRPPREAWPPSDFLALD